MTKLYEINKEEYGGKVGDGLPGVRREIVLIDWEDGKHDLKIINVMRYEGYSDRRDCSAPITKAGVRKLVKLMKVI